MSKILRASTSSRVSIYALRPTGAIPVPLYYEAHITLPPSSPDFIIFDPKRGAQLFPSLRSYIVEMMEIEVVVLHDISAHFKVLLVVVLLRYMNLFWGCFGPSTKLHFYPSCFQNFFSTE